MRAKAWSAWLQSKGSLRLFVQPVVGFGLALIALICTATWQQLEAERESLRRNTAQDLTNLALVMEQNAARALDEIDRTIRFLRETHERTGYATDWPSLIRQRFLPTNQTMHIGVIDRTGRLIASNVGPRDRAPIDLSDREHFRVHVHATGDRLFISKPIFTRVSGRWGVHLSRRLTDLDGHFAGVITIALDPDRLSQAYGALQLGEGSGVAIVGDDGIIRAGSGTFADALGRGYQEGFRLRGVDNFSNGTALTFELFKGHARTVADRPVSGYPLSVLVAATDSQYSSSWQRNRRNYAATATALSVLVLIAVLVAVRRRQQHETQIEYLARHDALTRAANRMRFREQLDEAYAGLDRGSKFALLLIDLDGFKSINDTHGHPFGDRLLQAVAERLRQGLRQGDQLARLGGDEFALIQSEAGCEEAAEALAARICALIAGAYYIDGSKIEIGASIGIAFGIKTASGAAEIVRAADVALYAAKAAGKGTYRVFTPAMDLALNTQISLEAGLANAIEGHQFVLYYQPTVDIDTGQVTGYEALLRWQHPERGLLSPAEFIPLAEKTGLIDPLGAWAIQRACEDLAQRPAHLKVAVNIAPVQFKSGNLFATVRDALAASGLAASRLILEITESTVLQNNSATIEQLHELRALGVRIAVDDFGTGYSSLKYLQLYPVDCIKIDRCFVEKLGETRSASAIVGAIISLAGNLGLSTIVEGVETLQQRDELMRLGCTEAQGYYFCQPKPAADILPAPMAESVDQTLAA